MSTRPEKTDVLIIGAGASGATAAKVLTERGLRVVAVDISEFGGKTAQPAALAAGTDRLMSAIAQLLSQLRGEPAPEKRWNPAEHGQRETGRLEP